MTPPGGSRDDEARDDEARDDEARDDPRREPGAAGQARRDDPELREMRSVWREMRDEDPPDRGLAGLLAAARSQAAAMQPRPSGWQRRLAALRRPPVLALATAMVLIAGAALIGRRVPHDAATHAVSDEAPRPAPSDPAHQAAPGDGLTAAAPSAVEHARAERRGAPTARGASPEPGPGALPPTAPAAAPGRASLRPAPPAATTSPSSPRGGAAPEDEAAAGAPAGPPPPAPARDEPSPEKTRQLGASSAIHGVDTAPAGAANDGARPAGPAAAPPPQRPSPARSKAAPDLYRQCEAAARRGDCAAVRRLADQIARTDDRFRARVAPDSPVARCLAR